MLMWAAVFAFTMAVSSHALLQPQCSGLGVVQLHALDTCACVPKAIVASLFVVSLLVVDVLLGLQPATVCQVDAAV
jgi:hypothetical protein